MPEEPELTIQGWGPTDPTDAGGDVTRALPKPALKYLTRELGWTPRSTPPVAVDQIRLGPSRLSEEARSRFVELLGEENVRTDRDSRLRRAGGKSYLDLLRRREGDASDAPDAVVLPGTTDETAALLTACGDLGVVVVPFGGGTSVVGGLAGVDPDDRPSVALDLSLMASVQSLDVPSSLVTVGPGMRGPALEQALDQAGLTFGHLPQSWEFATVGGYAATRSAGQNSTGVGRFDELVAGLTLATPSGVLELGSPPASAAGPDLLGLALGSEGTLGVITEVTLRVRPKPQSCAYEGWSFRSWAAGLAALQHLARHDLLPDIVRLSDPDETRANLLMASGTGARLLRGTLRTRGHGAGCLLVLGWEGLPSIVRVRKEVASSLLRDGGAVRLGRRIGTSWKAHRFSAPYLRDRLMDAGLLVETLETAATWTALPTVYDAVRRALRESLTRDGRKPLIMSHVSHGYPTGASLYVTALADLDDALPIQQWLTAKRAATDALLGAGGTLTHHHAVGADHRPWMEREIGPLGVEVLRAVKQRLDPQGICNPGVLLPD
ncbi:FAD-binding oxidoreductase [Blastococcus sp. CT_GayMR19]|uniref:FAD-binding oxidoreductase n=1 Tax=Blastococcus sp. CT_GayMR19 TaxID=2559608 RepID=UPI0010736B7E|nr:FAD-binding oxidoreductase [Blastococcus sp. CT_GayMR19]TFV74978.1 FAD-binding oxidoreductase [Blastococcus sp. CT_GayMR19]